MLNRVWVQKDFPSEHKPKIEEHIDNDGSYRYLCRSPLGNTFNLTGADEAKDFIVHFKMVDVTEERMCDNK